jgi:quercetin dioxygenase-like cupin family protein
VLVPATWGWSSSTTLQDEPLSPCVRDHEKHPDCASFAWPLGTWRGTGNGDSPTIDACQFGQERNLGNVVQRGGGPDGEQGRVALARGGRRPRTRRRGIRPRTVVAVAGAGDHVVTGSFRPKSGRLGRTRLTFTFTRVREEVWRKCSNLKRDRAGSWHVIDVNPGYKIKRIHVAPGHRLSYQVHDHRSKRWFVALGRVSCAMEGETVIAEPGQSVDVPGGQAPACKRGGQGTCDRRGTARCVHR